MWVIDESREPSRRDGEEAPPAESSMSFVATAGWQRAGECRLLLLEPRRGFSLYEGCLAKHSLPANSSTLRALEKDVVVDAYLVVGQRTAEPEPSNPSSIQEKFTQSSVSFVDSFH